MRFTPAGIRALRPRSERFEVWEDGGGGFGLRISPKGRKSFVLLYRFQGRPRRLTLGVFGDGPDRLTLADAYEAKAKALKMLEQGADPGAASVVARREARTAPTVNELADDYLERWAKPRKRSWREDERILRKDVRPAWGRRKAREIARRDVIALVDNVASRNAPIMANRTLATIRKMFNFAVAKDIIPASPCNAVSRPSPENRRDRVLTEEEIRALWQGLEASGMPEPFALLFKLQLLTAQRKGEVVAAEWSDFDLEQAWWTIPAERSKNKLAHRVPLSPQAICVVRRLRELSNGSAYLFPAARRPGPIRPEIPNKKLAERLEAMTLEDGSTLRNVTPHDLRRTAASYMASAGVPRIVISKILNHVERDVTAVYDRHGYDVEKRNALTRWGRTLNGILGREPKKVVSIVARNRMTAS